METLRILSLGIVLLAFITAAYVYPLMPETMIAHWSISGVPDGYYVKDFGVFFLPVLALATFCLFIALPFLDPLRKNYESFLGEFDMMIALIVGSIYYIYLLTLAYNMGYSIDMLRFLAPDAGIFFLGMGMIMRKAKQNWFIGIRTPWTLSSEKVWDKTHRLCSNLFIASGFIAFFGAAFQPALLVSAVMLVAAALFGIVYSYIEFYKEKNARAQKSEKKGKRTRKRA